MNFGAFPYLYFVWVSPPLEARIKAACLRGGVVTLVAAPMIGVVVLTLDNTLMFPKLLEGICAFFLFGVGLYQVSGRSCVSAGYLNLTVAAQVRRPLLALVIFEACLLVLTYLLLVMHAVSKTEVSTSSLITAMMVPIPLFGLTFLAYWTARSLLPPRQETLTAYGLSGQVISPPTSPGPPQR